MRRIVGLAVAVGVLAASPAAAALITLAPIADGWVKLFGTDELVTAGDPLRLFTSGGLQKRVILEFDLGAIPEGSTIDSAVLAVVRNGTFSVTAPPVALAIHLSGYSGDGVVTFGDYDTAGTSLGVFSEVETQPNGTEFSWSLTSVDPLQDALDSANDLLTIRAVATNIGILHLVSLETATTLAPPRTSHSILGSPRTHHPAPARHRPGDRGVSTTAEVVGAHPGHRPDSPAAESAARRR